MAGGGLTKTWFITGTSRGFGRLWAEGALERGDRVAATARDLGAIEELGRRADEDRLLRLSLDVTDKAGCERAVARAHAHFGRLDVIVNNAGTGLLGAVEEVSEREARDQLETNFFGALWVTKAALPLLREQGSGHFVQVSSVAGVQAWPFLGLYHASKWALEAMSQSLAGEVEPFGLKVTIVEPTSYATNREHVYAVHANPLPAYDVAGRDALSDGGGRADPGATVAALFRVVDAPNPPLRVLFGEGAIDDLRSEYSRRLALWEEWHDVSATAAGDRSA